MRTPARRRYKGVFVDYGDAKGSYKREKPYVVMEDGKCRGRYATVEQAAVQYARIEIGMPDLVIEDRAPPEATRPHSG